MKFRAKLNIKFYIISILFLGIVMFGWYGVFFLNKNQILMEDNLPMDNQTKMFLSVAMSLIVLSWTFSCLALVRQILRGCAFSMDDEGVNSTVTAIVVLAFIFVVPIRKIPYSAIERISKEDGMLTLHINKSEVEMISILRIFARKKYHFFYGFTKEKQEEIEAELKKHIKMA